MKTVIKKARWFLLFLLTEGSFFAIIISEVESLNYGLFKNWSDFYLVGSFFIL